MTPWEKPRPLPLAVAMAAAPAAGYVAVWIAGNGIGGCGPPGHALSGRLFAGAPFAFPLLAAGILLVVGRRRGWRVRTVVASVATTVAVAAALEVVVFLLEFGAHHCGE